MHFALHSSSLVPSKQRRPTPTNLQAVPAVSYVNEASNTVAVRIFLTRIGGPVLVSSNRFIFMLLASKTLASPSVKFSDLNSTTSVVKCYVKVDQSGGSSALVLNQTAMIQSSMARQCENLFRAQFGDKAPVLPYCGHGSTDTPSLMLRCVSEAIVQEVVGMVSDTGRLDGGDSATGKCDFALELLQAVGPGDGALMVPAPCLFKNAPDLPYRRLAPLGQPSQTRIDVIAEAIAALGGDTHFLLAVNQSRSMKFPDWQFDTSGEGGLPWQLQTIVLDKEKENVIFWFLSTGDKRRGVNIDISQLDVRIALAGAPNRTTYRRQPTYKRRGPAPPTLLPIYRDAL